jgi:hypothetical protein
MEANGQIHARAVLLQVKEPPVPLGYEAGFDPEPVFTLSGTQKFAPTENHTLADHWQ